MPRGEGADVLPQPDAACLRFRLIRSVNVGQTSPLLRQARRRLSLWAKARGIAIRFGAVGKYGSTCPSKPWRSRIAIIERFIRTLKDEGTRKIVVPFGFEQMRDELGAIITWYNDHRPHMTLKARTPKEVYDDVPLTPVPTLLPWSQAPPMKLTLSFLAGRTDL